MFKVKELFPTNKYYHSINITDSIFIINCTSFNIADFIRYHFIWIVRCNRFFKISFYFLCIKSINTPLAHNAALSGEQRIPPQLKYCAVNTKVELNRKCRALGIRLKRFVMCRIYVT
ncbi:hypothetical protein EOJ41_18745 [Vibrio alginolyticus]|nr:hypothetical protein EOJ41_18745 [Vibrio alginolyticus]